MTLTRLADETARASRGLPAIRRPGGWQRLDASDPGSVRLVLSVRAVGNLVAVLATMAALAMFFGVS